MKSRMLLMILMVLSAVHESWGNGITISNVSVAHNGTTAVLHFNLSWNNSWRNGATGSYDAAMIFAKFRDLDGQWKPLQFVQGGYTDQPGYTTTTLGTGNQTNFFIYRSGPGIGNTSLTDVKIDIANPPTGSFNVRVFGIEMVLIPTGSFSAGDGLSDEFYRDGNSTTPFLINSAIPPAMGIAPGQLNDVNGNGSLGTTANDYPVGYSNFFIMKYEISQAAYRDFLNTLTYTQQVTRTAVAPNSPAGTGALVNYFNRNYIRIRTSGVASNQPAVYGCNADVDATFDESNDGEWVVCNYLSWMDLCAYLDWAGLRPMSELEYEKATATNISGSLGHNPGQYAWGNNLIMNFGSNSFINQNTASEDVSTTSLGSGNAAYFGSGLFAPVRNGTFAESFTNAMTSGATYWGVMEMTGNVWEMMVATCFEAGRSLKAFSMGDGQLDANGNAIGPWPGANGNSNPHLPVTSGPVTDAAGMAIRGGSFIQSAPGCRSCDRLFVGSFYTNRSETNGGRGVFAY